MVWNLGVSEKGLRITENANWTGEFWRSHEWGDDPKTKLFRDDITRILGRHNFSNIHYLRITFFLLIINIDK